MRQFQCSCCGIIITLIDCEDFEEYIDLENLGLCGDCKRALKDRRR